MEDLQAKALQQFDKLVERGDLVFRDAAPVHVQAQPFNLQFRIAASLSKKPQVPVTEAEQKPKEKPISPFANDPPDFVIEHVGSKHTLRLNKFCVVRPQFVLHTNDFEPQIEPLSMSDMAAAWSVLRRLESPHMVIYNGGMQGGWSLPHRHVQLLPRPPKDIHNLYPDIFGIQNGTIPGIPFKHAARALPTSITEAELFTIYKELLAAAGVNESDWSHNLIFVREWMLVIPRSRSGQEGVNIVNAAAMVGMIWIPSQEVLDVWLRSSNPIDILTSLGKPW